MRCVDDCVTFTPPTFPLLRGKGSHVENQVLTTDYVWLYTLFLMSLTLTTLFYTFSDLKWSFMVLS